MFPEKLHLLNTAQRRVSVSGLPGTGKTVVLQLKATEWMRCGDDIYIVLLFLESRAACSMLYHLLLQIVNTQRTSVVSRGQPHLLKYDIFENEDLEKSFKDMSLAVRGRSLYVIADEVLNYFSVMHAGLLVEYLTRPLRSPPTVVREVQQDVSITMTHGIKPCRERGVPEHTGGPPVRRLYHRGEGHSGFRPQDCVACGLEIASFLHSLRVPEKATTSTTVTTMNNSTTPPCIQRRDLLLLCHSDIPDQSCVVTTEADIPVRVMKDDDIEDVVTARSDVVWVTHRDRVRGLERKVVVFLQSFGSADTGRLHEMSRCTSQLLVVSFDR